MVVAWLRKLEHWGKQTINLKGNFGFIFFNILQKRRSSVFPKFLQFKVSNKKLRAAKAYISCQKGLLNQEVNNKKKAVKILQEKVIEVKNSLNCKISYIDYVHVCNTFLVSYNKNIAKVKETQDKKLCNQLLIKYG